jgi:hypothetical protein
MIDLWRRPYARARGLRDRDLLVWDLPRASLISRLQSPMMCGSMPA